MFRRIMTALLAAGMLAAFSAGCGDKYRNEAEKKFLDAAKKGDAEAQFNLGASYEFGAGAKKDIDRAREWYEKAARQGNKKAKARLRSLNPPKAPTAEEAAAYFNAYRNDTADADALYKWGECCEFGFHTDQDRDAALRLYLLAADKGSAAAKERAEELAAELCPPEDEVKKYHAAARKGDAEAQYQIARCFELGFHKERNGSTAKVWYDRAARQGDPRAQKWQNRKKLKRKAPPKKKPAPSNRPKR